MAVGALTLSLAGCGQGEGKAGASTAVAAVSGDEATQNKFNHYTEGFNKLIDDNWGVREKYNDYVEADIPAAQASGDVYFAENISNLEQALFELKESRALDGGPQAAETDNKVEYDLISGDIDSMIGDYRDLKQENSDSDRESIADNYNRAVSQMNEPPGEDHGR